MPAFTETTPVNGQNLGLYLSLPDGDGPFPGVWVKTSRLLSSEPPTLPARSCSTLAKQTRTHPPKT